MSHTPGPWVWGADSLWGDNDEVLEAWATEADEGGVEDCGVRCRNEADRLLIAAAPDLLAALETFVKANNEGAPSEWLQRMANCHNLAVAAIKKSRGE